MNAGSGARGSGRLGSAGSDHDGACGLRTRRAEASDAAALVALARAVSAEPGRWLVTAGDWRSVGDERRHLRSARRSSDVLVLVAQAEAGIVGRLTIVRDPNPACGHVADIGLMVAREHRRRGVGRALLHAAERWARQVGIRKIELHVFPHNVAALALYESVGYQREGYRARHFRRAGELVDAILMAKQL
jgi:ribosomal-protein-alanine N-acetyltransferase